MQLIYLEGQRCFDKGTADQHPDQRERCGLQLNYAPAGFGSAPGRSPASHERYF